MVYSQAVYAPVKAKVSIVIPVYNAEKYLGECLDAVLGQTLRELEVICVDDGSTDDSLRILGERAKSDMRLSVIRQENAGAGAARNRGLAAATGDYIAFMDADDFYPDADTLSCLYADAVGSGLPVVCGTVELLDPDGSVQTSGEGFPSFDRKGAMEFRTRPFDWGYQACLFARQLLTDADLHFPAWRRYQDPPFLVRALLAAKTFFADPRPAYRYRVEHKKVDWAANGCRKILDLLGGIREEMTVADRQGVEPLCRQLIRRCQLQFGGILCIGLRRSEDVRCIVRELEQDFPGLMRTPLQWLALRNRLGFALPYVGFKVWWMLRNEGLCQLLRRVCQ